MIGPVLSFELLRTSRRGWHHLLLWIYGGWLLLQVGVQFLFHLAGHLRFLFQGTIRTLPPELFASYSQDLVEQLVVQQFLLLLLVVPAFAAGSISDEKTRGTLQEWLTTDLSAWEIVRGKLAAQIIQLGTLSLAGLPLFAFFGAFAGLDLTALGMLVLTVLVQLTALSAASLLASVWCKRTTTAVLSVYVAGGLLFALARWLRIHDYFDPLYLLKPAWLYPDSAQLGRRLVYMGIAWGSVLGVCLMLAVWRLRPAYRRQLASEGFRAGGERGRQTRPPVSGNPLRWKEHWLGEVPAPPMLRRLPRPLAVAGTSLLTLGIGATILLAHLPRGVGWVQVLRLGLAGDIRRLIDVWTRSSPSSTPFLVLSLAVTALFALGVGIRCAGVVSGERERKSWDTLLTTPMEPRHILRGKLWGVIDSARPYLLAYIIPAVLLAVGGGVLAVIWVVFWWAVTWIIMLFMGATGVRCSVRSQNSWRSLLASLLSNAWIIGLRYLMFGAPIGGLATGLVIAVIGAMHAVTMPPGSFAPVGVVVFVLLSLGLTMFWLIAEAEYQLTTAEQWIHQHERISPLKLRAPRVLQRGGPRPRLF
jgi:ABC-type transport system involved in multi-copper enzyme maturation permease subunit